MNWREQRIESFLQRDAGNSLILRGNDQFSGTEYIVADDRQPSICQPRQGSAVPVDQENFLESGQ